MAQYTVGPADIIKQTVTVIVKQGLAGAFFVINYLFDNRSKIIDGFFFTFAEGGLVGYLKKIAEIFRTFTENSAGRQMKFVYAVDGRSDLVGEHQPGQVEHHRSTHTGADIGRTTGQIAQLFIKGIVDFLTQGIVNSTDFSVDFRKLKSGTDGLHPDLIFFIDHDGTAFLRADHKHFSCRISGNKFRTCQTPFKQYAAFRFIENREIEFPVFTIEIKDFSISYRIGNGLAYLLFFCIIGRAGEAVVCQIACQPDTGGDCNAVTGNGISVIEETYRAGEEFFYGADHDQSSSNCFLISLIRSRQMAAFSYSSAATELASSVCKRLSSCRKIPVLSSLATGCLPR